MDAIHTLDHFFVPDLASPANQELLTAFAKLKPEGCPKLKKNGVTRAFDAIERLSKDAIEVIDRSSGRDKAREEKAEFAGLLVSASIAAAKSDQRLTKSDLETIASMLVSEAGSDVAMRHVREEILRPMMIEHMTRRHWTRAETVELYAASRLSTNMSDELSEHYLKMLAARLGLEQALTDQIETEILGGR